MTTFPVPVSVEPVFLPIGGTFGQNAVVRPKTIKGLAAVMAVATQKGYKVVAESGEPGYNPATIEKRLAGAIVAKLDAFKEVTAAPDGTVVAGAAATIGSVVAAAKEAGVLLPVPDLPYETVVDALRSGVQSMFSRTIGTLRGSITAATIVFPDGTIKFAVADTDAAMIDDALSKDSDAIIASLSFCAVPADEAGDYWLARTVALYKSSVVPGLLSALFEKVTKSIPKKADIVVNCKAAMYNIPVVIIQVSGKGDHTKDKFLMAVKDAILAAYGATGNTKSIFQVFKGAAVGPHTVAIGEMGRRTHGKEAVPLNQSFPRGAISASISRVAEVLDETLGINAEGKVQNLHISSSSRISVGQDGELEVSAFLFKPIYPSADDEAVFSRFNSAVPGRMFPGTPNFATLKDTVAPPAVPSDIRVMEGPIPNFKGNVYTQADPDYEDRAHQYATSSYPAEDMTPYMVAYPLDEADVAAAIAYAKTFTTQKSIVGRSGGHQYCGLSSGGNDTIVLSMDYFRDVVPDATQHNIITAGVGVRLTHGASEFDKAGVTVPHGECPLVAFGGHTQSGGYGHLLRSYGLIVDHVRSFRIVVGDGTAHEVIKPGVDGVRTLANNDDVFFAVLGGGPSSFGVLTTITYETIKNDDHPYSGGLMATLAYKKQSFEKIVRELQRRTQLICAGDTLQPDNDMMASAISFDITGFIHGEIGTEQPDPEGGAGLQKGITGGRAAPSSDGKAVGEEFSLIPDGFLLLELVYGDRNASEDTYNSTIASFRALYEDVQTGTLLSPQMHWTSFDGQEPLSYMSDAFVRRYGTGEEGREFIYPYEKRLNGTFVPLTDGFVDGFVDICTRVIEDPAVRLVFQVGLGGSQHKNGALQDDGSGGTKAVTGASRRECAIQVVFDVFYTDGNKSVAENYQVEMGALLDREFPEQQAVRLLWGSYGDTDIQNVWQYYYDSPELYRRLQGIKQDVDPTDVFHTRFNVQLPSNQSV